MFRSFFELRHHDEHPSNTIVNGITRIGFMTGGKAARWADEDIADVLTDEAKPFISCIHNKLIDFGQVGINARCYPKETLKDL